MDLEHAEVKRILKFQGNKCFLCLEPIMSDQEDLKAVNVDRQTVEQIKLEKDHIIAKSLPKGLDSEENYAIMHLECNRKKGTKPLLLARRILAFERDKRKNGEDFTLGKVLELARGRYSLGAKIKKVFFRNLGDNIAEVKFKTQDEKSIARRIPIVNDPTGSTFKSI